MQYIGLEATIRIVTLCRALVARSHDPLSLYPSNNITPTQGFECRQAGAPHPKPQTIFKMTEVVGGMFLGLWWHRVAIFGGHPFGNGPKINRVSSLHTSCSGLYSPKP